MSKFQKPKSYVIICSNKPKKGKERRRKKSLGCSLLKYKTFTKSHPRNENKELKP
jgi:hypothetical protein